MRRQPKPRFGLDCRNRLHAFLDMKEYDAHGHFLTPVDDKTAWRMMSDTLKREYRYPYGDMRTLRERAQAYGSVHPGLVHDGRMNVTVLERVERNSWEGETWTRQVLLQTSADIDLAQRLCAIWRPCDYGEWHIRTIKASDLRPYESGCFGYMPGYGLQQMTPGLRRNLNKVLDYMLHPLDDRRAQHARLDDLLYKMLMFDEAWAEWQALTHPKQSEGDDR